MDVGDVCTPFPVNGFCLKITFQDIYFIIWDSAMVCMMVILPHHNRAQALFCHMPLDTFYTAGSSAAIEGAAYLDSAIPLF